MIVINPKQEQPVSGTVIGRAGTLYRVRTGSGKVITATSSSTWAIGSGVTVLAGEIVGKAGRMMPTKIYRV
ncbi:MAG: hypothetical protein AB7U29_10625 [Desulfobulbus sp.]